MNEIYSDFVVKCYYIFNDEKNYYYAMEYLPGGDLFNFIQENEITLPVKKIVSLIKIIFFLFSIRQYNS